MPEAAPQLEGKAYLRLVALGAAIGIPAAFVAAIGPAESAVRGNLVEALEYE